MPEHDRPSFLQRLFSARPATGAAAHSRAHAAPTPDAHVTPDHSRCVQCGVCGHNCPVGIPVRDYARQGKVVDDPRCVQCGQCIEACPRGTLRWSRGHLEALAAPDAAEYERLMQVFFPGEGEAG